MRYFISQYMASERNGLWAVGQSWREVSHSHSQVQRGTGGETTKQPFPVILFSIGMVKNLLLSTEVQREMKQMALS